MQRCNARRCNARRCNARRCNARRCNIQPASGIREYLWSRRCKRTSRTNQGAPHAPWEHRAATRLRRYICLKTCFLRATRRLRIADGERSGTVHPPVASAQLWSTARPNGSPPSPNDCKRVLTYAPLRRRATHSAQHTPCTAAHLRCTVRALHRRGMPNTWHAPARETCSVKHEQLRHATCEHNARTRTALVFEIVPPSNVTAPSSMRTTPP